MPPRESRRSEEESLRLLDGEYAIDGLLFECLLAAAGPFDDDLVDYCCCTEAEVKAGIILREIAGLCYALLQLVFCTGEDLDFCTDAVAIAFCSDELDGEPVAGAGCDVVNKLALSAEVYEEGVDLSVVVVVSEARAPSYCPLVDDCACGFRDVSEFAVAEALEQRVLLRDEMNEATVKDKHVEKAVIVEVVDAGSPADVLRVGLRHAVACADVVEGQLAGVLEHAVVVAIGNKEVEHAAAFKVGEYRAHG